MWLHVSVNVVTAQLNWDMGALEELVALKVTRSTFKHSRDGMNQSNFKLGYSDPQYFDALENGVP